MSTQTPDHVARLREALSDHKGGRGFAMYVNPDDLAALLSERDALADRLALAEAVVTAAREGVAWRSDLADALTDHGPLSPLDEAWKELIAEALRRNVVVAVGKHRTIAEAAVQTAARLDIRWLLDNSNPMHYQGCDPDGCTCGVSAQYEAVIDRQADREAAIDRAVSKP